ncbi:M3 family metallopeptidase [Aspergillus ibericus CBS 121593]|uniref:Zincin n=1 Tax=Aspergillus ibericus CBS 121593 TaxID=1448316 RepID=A0A395GPL0_9EURO|nr:zincin [Aspergillus ibericus CBS 121593]RAK95973.1 zincin [Aspergillus ibericus CBS 121593]
MAIPEYAHLPTFDITPAALLGYAHRLVEKVRVEVDKLVDSVCVGSATFDSVVHPLADLDNEFKYDVQYIALFQSVAPSPDLRKASSEAVNLVNQAYLALFQDEPLFALVDAAYGRTNDIPDEESTRLLARFHRMFVDNGLQLVGASRERFKWIAKRRLELRNQFMDNIASDPGSLWIPTEALEGLDDHMVKNLDGDQLKRIRLDRPTVNAVLGKCSVAQTRRDVFLSSQSIYPDNVDLFQETIRLRDEAAPLLGFPSFAAQQLRHQLVKSPSAVHDLLENLAHKLQPIASRELQALRSLSGSDLHLWDFEYYHRRLLQEKYQVNHDLISEYFPAEYTIQRMLSTFERLFGLSITEVEEKSDRHVWHPEVRVFTVRDQDSSLLGYLYTDIYPRPGKYNHAANFNIHPGFRKKDGSQSPVATALVCNVSPATADLPALLQHREVITLFHELGHGIHDLLGKAKYAIFSGHRTVRDFVEAPSQLLEYWCWVPECLQQLSCHYSHLPEYSERWSDAAKGARPPKEIPESLVQGLAAVKQVNQGILTLRQVAFSKFDMQIHDHCASSTSTPIAEVYNSLLQEMTLLQGPGGWDWGHGYATTSHYMWGQEANYYSYLYTRTLAADIWAFNFRNDPMSEEAGLRYRRMILAKGGSVDEFELLREFLGRVPSAEAYLQDLGVDPA